MTNTIILPRTEVAGRYKLEVRRQGQLIHDTGWFDNLITNAGLEAIGEAKALCRYAMVGTDNTAPANTNTTLGAQIASKDGDSAPSATTSQGIETSGTRYGWMRKTFPFSQGAVVGNVAEVGVGWSSTAVFSRSLVSPAISLLAIDQLTVVYEIRMYLPTADATGSVTIGGTSYNYTIRPAYAASSSYSGLNLGWAPGLLSLSASTRVWTTYNAGSGKYSAIAYAPPAVIQSNVETTEIKQTDGGTNSLSDVASSASNAAYSAGSLSCQFSVNWGISSGNLAGGIKAFIYTGMFGTYQCVLDAAIPKDNTKTLSMTWSQTWARRP